MKILSFIETPFAEKFGTPRQPLLVEEAWGKLRFPKDDFYKEAFRGLESFTHLWLIFEFSQVGEEEVKALIRPPRFGGKEKRGVFATRSPHRPNRLGLSVVKFDRLEETREEVVLWVKGVDLVNGTPILDIKPYVPYVDSVTGAQAGEFHQRPEFWPVQWSCEVPVELQDKTLIEKVISLDPRPNSDRNSDSEFGVSVAGWNVRFKSHEGGFLINDIRRVDQLKS
jgi:tRNA-Thr(GGU) m(6)t(6)A37 methyltransferase TsaA